jgi:tetratricopeptide (TPR) repeat protein
MSPRLRVVAIAILLLAPSVAAQQRGRPSAADPEALYRRCLEVVDRDPSGAFEHANAWRARGGGDPARHCAAMAVARLGRHREAAGMLEELATSMTPAFTHLRPDLLLQAGQTWVLAGDAARAHAVLSTGLDLAPGRVDLWVERAIALGLATNYEPAIADLDRALAIEPRRPDALVLRATARRFTDRLDRARADVDAALAIDPRHIDGLLERGILKRLAEDRAGARADWMQVLRIGPETPQAEAARANLERLDLGR